MRQVGHSPWRGLVNLSSKHGTGVCEISRSQRYSAAVLAPLTRTGYMTDGYCYSVTEERLDLLKLDYISNREERKQQSLIKNKKDRIESMKRHAGIKDAPVGPGR